jgi:hypothetical protein
MPAADALKQQNRGQPVVEPGQLPGELHARPAPTTDQPRLWLVIHVWIIGVPECRYGTGNIVRRASVEATSVAAARARARRLQRIRTVRIGERLAQTAAGLAGACGQAAYASQHWGRDGPVSGSFRTSIKLTSPAAGDVQYARVGRRCPGGAFHDSANLNLANRPLWALQSLFFVDTTFIRSWRRHPL